jgi:hypothetical protein
VGVRKSKALVSQWFTKSDTALEGEQRFELRSADFRPCGHSIAGIRHVQFSDVSTSDSPYILLSYFHICRTKKKSFFILKKSEEDTSFSLNSGQTS